MSLRFRPTWLACIGSLACLAACSDGTPTSAVGITTTGDTNSSGDGQIGDSTSPADGTLGDTSSGDSTPGSDAGTDSTSTDVSSPDDAQAFKYAKCSDLLSCVAKNCTPDVAVGCEDLCLTGASPTAKAAIAPVFTCIDQVCRKGKCAGGADPTCVGQCAQKSCGYKTMECAADGKTGSTLCTSVFVCMQACKDDIACLGGCYASMSPSAQADFDALMACSATAGGADAFKSCPGQALQCISGGKTGTAGCWDTLQCINACPKDDGNCAATCYGKASSAGQKALIAATPCFDKNSDPACPALLTACIDPKGSQTCVQVIDCADKCGKSGGGDACGLVCLQQASKTEAQKFLALAQCSDVPCKACTTDSCKATCAKDNCPSQWSACLGQ